MYVRHMPGRDVRVDLPVPPLLVTGDSFLGRVRQMELAVKATGGSSSD